MMPWSFGDHDGLSFALCATCSVLHQRSFKEDGTDYGFSRHGPLNILQTYSTLKYQSQAKIGCLHRPRLHLLHNLFAFSGLHECLLQISLSIGKLGFAWAMPVVCWPRPITSLFNATSGVLPTTFTPSKTTHTHTAGRVRVRVRVRVNPNPNPTGMSSSTFNTQRIKYGSFIHPRSANPAPAPPPNLPRCLRPWPNAFI